ncbi:2-aminoethanethiol dioxygenase [Episyrphus balteatus]|uniref:2-aminoethanethiol dioxygenase n=1 Tax=Episyrphus balteatus TaxID=286459 RepID=UPI0024865611|nr:2-aminoethanethiol dioxygenase [Episyrphus balteatus]
MTSLFTKILRQAFKTFDKSNTASLSTNLKILYQLTEQLTYRDININPEVFIQANSADKAPCTYIHVFESAEVSMSVFILKANYTMPLHDHPMMNGILKGIYGNLLIKSYSAKKNNSDSGKRSNLLYDKLATEIEVTEDEPRQVNPESECAILTPSERNFHEITAVGGVAAFFDILSPPYGADIPIYGRRKCHFYHRVSIDDHRLVLLRMIPEPLDYYCDTAEAPEAVALSQNTYLEMYGHTGNCSSSPL